MDFAAMLALSNVGCTSVPQPTMEELLAEVNAEHQGRKGVQLMLHNMWVIPLIRI